VIDPQLVYSSYLGGTGNDAGQKVAIDSAGYVSIVGWTRSVDFPVVGPLQGANGGTTNAFIAKFDPSASGAASLIYSTYLGGTGSTVGRAISVDAAGDAFVVGDTNSPNFPVTLGAYQTTCKLSGSSCSTDIFAARLDSTGSVLQYSTYIGGTGIDRGFDLAVDSAGRMVITGPSGSSNFPVTTGAYQRVYAGGAAEFGDATVTLLNPDGGGAADLVYATYLGGSGQEQAWGIAVDAAGAIYVSGSTTSANFPTTVSAFSTTYAGSGANTLGDAFVSKLRPNGLGVNDLVYSTFLGGASDDRAEDIAIDSQSQIYVTGFTMSSGFPVTAASAYDTTFGGGTCYSAPCADAFIVKIDSSVSGEASLLYSTFLGGSGFDLGHALALDPNGFVHISGETTSSGFPLVDPIQSTCTGGCPSPLVDAFVSTFDLSQAGASGLVFSTFLGGSDVDTPWGMAADANGNLYVTGQVFSTNFPMVTPYQSACRNCVTFNSSNRSGDGFLFKICTTSCPGGSIDPSSLTFVVANVGGTASSQRVTLSNSGNSALTIVGIDITGTNAGDFSQTNTCPASLNPRTNCFIDVSFTAGGAGPRSATLTISPNAAPLAVSLTGIVAPQVTVTSPNTGVSWTVGEARSITFNHNLGAGQAVTIDVSRDGGNTWSPITSYTTTAATTGTYSWTVTAPTTTQTRIRVTWAADSSVTDLSDVNFAITNLYVTVTSPNSNVKWRVAETRAIKFNHNLGVGQRLNIDVSRDGGGTWSPITVFTTTSATSGTYNWLVTGPATTRALIRVTAVSDPAITDTSNVTFTILARVTVTAPNTSLTWGAGSIRTVKWTHNLGTSQTVNIAFSADGGASWAPLAAGVPNATSTTGSWTGPMPSTVTTQARIRISQATNPSEFDVSDVNFTLAAPFVYVKYPNSNVLWTTGSSYTITWNHNLGALEHVNVELSRDGGATWQTIGANVGLSSTSGSFAWVATGPATTTARVRVSWVSNASVRDDSNVNFRIQ
jgi:hypothetical protein